MGQAPTGTHSQVEHHSPLTSPIPALTDQPQLSTHPLISVLPGICSHHVTRASIGG